MKDFNELRDRAYKNACEHGFHDEEWSDDHLLCLVICELMEAMQADRKGRRADKDMFESLMNIANEIIPKDELNEKFKLEYECCIKGSVDEEIADACIRLFDIAGLRGLNIDVVTNHTYFENNCLFTEAIYCIVSDITNDIFPLQDRACHALSQIFLLANKLNIDLVWHIETKMKYNEMRPYKHGCKY